MNDDALVRFEAILDGLETATFDIDNDLNEVINYYINHVHDLIMNQRKGNVK